MLNQDQATIIVPEAHPNAAEAAESRVASPSLPARFTFRFCFVYFSLYIALTQTLSTLVLIPKIEIPQLDWLWPTRPVVTWVAVHVFQKQGTLVVTGSGSGDKTYDWVEMFCIAALAMAAAAIWTAADRRARSDLGLRKWFHVVVRFALGSTMFIYGFDKIVPLQMPFPNFAHLVKPFGNFSPAGILWYSIGASPAYEMFAGCAETLGGILVLIPRTSMLGALVCLADVTQVFILNMTYDVPVKLFSFHLILQALFVLAPDATRLLNFFVLGNSAGPSAVPLLFKTVRRNRIASAVQILLAVYLMGMNLYNSRQAWYQFGDGAPRSALYGLWDVEQFSLDGQAHAPLLTDNDCWRRVIFQYPTSMTVQRMNETFLNYGAKVDTKTAALALTKADDKNWKGQFTFSRPAPDRLILDGEADHHKIHAELRLVDPNKFLLLSRGFHWIQEYPFIL